MARHEHHRIEHRGIAGGRSAHPHRPAVYLGLLARRYPQPAKTRAIDSDREGLLERLNDVSAKIRRQRDRAGYRVDDDDLHAAGLVRLPCPRKVRPEAEGKVQRLHLHHFRVPVDQRNEPARLARVVIEQAVGFRGQDHDFGRGAIDRRGKGLHHPHEHARHGQHEQPRHRERNDGRKIAAPFVEQRGQGQRHRILHSRQAPRRTGSIVWLSAAVSPRSDAAPAPRPSGVLVVSQNRHAFGRHIASDGQRRVRALDAAVTRSEVRSDRITPSSPPSSADSNHLG